MKASLAAPPRIPALPDHWRVVKLKHLASVRSSNVDKKTEDGEQPVRLCNYVDVYHNERVSDGIDFMPASATRREIMRFRLRRGDVLVTKDSEAPDDIAVPAYVTKDFDDVLCAYHLAQIRPNQEEVEGLFLYYCFAADVLNSQLQVMANGITRFGLSVGALSGARFPVPPIDEQRAVVGFLDEKIALVDGLVAKKERLGRLLEEKVHATCTRAVTQGLDSTVSRRNVEDGVVRSIPTHWRVMRLKHLAIGPLMYGANEAADIDDPDFPRYIRITDLAADGTLREETFRSLPSRVARPYMLRHGDILLARSGATVGKAIRYRDEWGPACFAGYLIRVRPDPRKVLPEYLELFTRGQPYRRQVEISTVQATIQNVGAQRYGEFRIPLPPLHEQQDIVNHVRRIDESARKITSNLREQIAKLGAYRQALISAAVTGQIDVRDHASRADSLPQELTA